MPNHINCENVPLLLTLVDAILYTIKLILLLVIFIHLPISKIKQELTDIMTFKKKGIKKHSERLELSDSIVLFKNKRCIIHSHQSCLIQLQFAVNAFRYSNCKDK